MADNCHTETEPKKIPKENNLSKKLEAIPATSMQLNAYFQDMFSVYC